MSLIPQPLICVKMASRSEQVIASFPDRVPCSDFQKFSRNGIALLDKPAVALTIEFVIIFEKGYGR
ncbi:MAG: hypothetical protein AB1473_06935 [Thermodesulfobacteriota bacterium]